MNVCDIEAPAAENSSGPEFGLTATDILEYLYCPRFAYFESYLCIPEHQEKRFKVQTGRTIHDDKARLNPDYLRKKLGVVKREKSVYLASPLGMRGVVDEILFLKDGSAAPLDYKYAEYKERTFKNHRYQLTFYGQLIVDNYAVPVHKGYIVYTRSRNKVIEVEITGAMYAELQDIIKELMTVVGKGKYPPPTKAKARCLDCCYRNICEKVI